MACGAADETCWKHQRAQMELLRAHVCRGRRDQERGSGTVGRSASGVVGDESRSGDGNEDRDQRCSGNEQ
eukprot:2339553-Pleurochrysis_carterae.AAC.1